MSISNGHVSGLDANVADASPQATRSESDLSDVNDINHNQPTETGQDENAASEDDAMHNMVTSDEGDSADAAGEEDADFDEETPPPEPASGMRQERSESDDSQRSSKRKAGEVDDDEYMKQNPELYGLRRSVRIPSPLLQSHFTDLEQQGRARQSRKVVSLNDGNLRWLGIADTSQVPSSDDEDDDEDAVNTGNRRKRQKTTSTRPSEYPCRHERVLFLVAHKLM